MSINGGQVLLAPDDLREFVDDAHTIVAPIARKTSGCIFFSIAVDDPAAGSALVCEQWHDQAALDALLEQPAVKAHFAKSWNCESASSTGRTKRDTILNRPSR